MPIRVGKSNENHVTLLQSYEKPKSKLSACRRSDCECLLTPTITTNNKAFIPLSFIMSGDDCSESLLLESSSCTDNSAPEDSTMPGEMEIDQDELPPEEEEVSVTKGSIGSL